MASKGIGACRALPPPPHADSSFDQHRGQVGEFAMTLDLASVCWAINVFKKVLSLDHLNNLLCGFPHIRDAYSCRFKRTILVGDVVHETIPRASAV